MDFVSEIVGFQVGLKGFRPYSRDFTSGFKFFRDFTSAFSFQAKFQRFLVRFNGLQRFQVF